jgi:hypothetical protein
MNVLRHDDISQNYKPIAPAYSFKDLQEQITTRSVGEQRLPRAATEREEM